MWMTFEAKQFALVGMYMMFDIVRYLSMNLIDISETQAWCSESLRNVYIVSCFMLCSYTAVFAVLTHKDYLCLQQLEITSQGNVVAAN